MLEEITSYEFSNKDKFLLSKKKNKEKFFDILWNDFDIIY
jgi:hypothetical protein